MTKDHIEVSHIVVHSLTIIKEMWTYLLMKLQAFENNQ